MKMYPITRARLWLRSIVAGEKCIACGEMNTRGRSLMCPECEDDLKRSHLGVCPQCLTYARDCLCPPDIMREGGISVLVKYAFYDAAQPDQALNRIIRRLKTIPDGLAFAYFAAILSQPIARLAAANGYTAQNTVLTHIPRSKNGIARDGYDQARSLAAAVAKRAGFSHKTLIRRIKHGTQQKYLDTRERIENVRGMFEVKCPEQVRGKHIIVVDDLVTTGATVTEAAKMLYAAGALSVICVCIAEAERQTA